MRLSFGQTVLTKRRARPKRLLATSSPAPRMFHRQQGVQPEGDMQTTLPLGGVTPEPRSPKPVGVRRGVPSEPTEASGSTVDQLTDSVIKSNFDPRVIGLALNRIADSTGSLEQVVAFAAIVAKARIARNRRR